MLDAAIVGLGRWGKNMVNAVQGRRARLRFTRAVARRPENARDFAAQHGIALTTSLAEVLADPAIRMVVLTTPHSLHYEQILAVAAAGKAVFCEKPLTLTLADARAAVAACRAAGVPLGLGHDKRFFPSMRALQRVVAGGTLGDILHIEGHFSNETTRRFHTGWRDSPHESPGGGLTATGIHILDAFVELAGPAQRVYAQLLAHAPDPSPVDALAITIAFQNKVSGMLCSVRSTPYFWRVHVFGKQGSAEALGDRELVLRYGDDPPQHQNFDTVDTLRFELEAFADAVEGKAAYPITVEQMLADVALFEATLKSVDAGAPVPVESI